MPEVPLETSAVDRLLGPVIGPGGLPSRYLEVAKLLEALRAGPSEEELANEAQEVMALAAFLRSEAARWVGKAAAVGAASGAVVGLGGLGAKASAAGSLGAKAAASGVATSLTAKMAAIAVAAAITTNAGVFRSHPSAPRFTAQGPKIRQVRVAAELDPRTRRDLPYRIVVNRPDGAGGVVNPAPRDDETPAAESPAEPDPLVDILPPEEPPVLAEDPPVEDPPVEEPPAEDPPVEEPPADEPVEDPPADEPPAEPPVDEPPTDQPPAEDPPAEDPPGDDEDEGDDDDEGDGEDEGDDDDDGDDEGDDDDGRGRGDPHDEGEHGDPHDEGEHGDPHDEGDDGSHVDGNGNGNGNGHED